MSTGRRIAAGFGQRCSFFAMLRSLWRKSRELDRIALPAMALGDLWQV